MRTRNVVLITLGTLALLGGLAVASAYGGGLGRGFGFPGPHGPRQAAVACDDNITVGECRALMGDPCNDDMTVGECHAALEAKRAEKEAEHRAACVEEHGEEFCDAMPMPGPHGPGPHGRHHAQHHPANETAAPDA